MLILGLTGSIATGKSTVSSLLAAPPHNLPIIDADKIARQVVEPGTPAYAKIVAHFAPSTPDLLLPADTNTQDGNAKAKGRPLNRPALGRRVFGSGAEREADRKTLNGIVHPAVRREMYKQLAAAYVRGHWAVVLDVPLLFESGWERYCGCIIVVGVRDAAVQIARLRARDSHLTEEDARNRVMSQGNLEEKVERCRRRGDGWGEVLWNDEGRKELEREVASVMERVRSGSPWWWGTLLWVCPPVAVGVAVGSWWKMWGVQKRWEEERRQEKAKL